LESGDIKLQVTGDKLQLNEKDQLKNRTKKFAVDVIKLVKNFPYDHIYKSLGNQLLRSATSVSANYRAAKKARSTAEFIAKLGIVAEEIDESKHWFELLVESALVIESSVTVLYKEADEIAAMIHASIKTAKHNRI
jgi:four helix bundle protein